MLQRLSFLSYRDPRLPTRSF